MGFPEPPQTFQRGCGKGNVTLLVALADDAQCSVGTIDVRDGEFLGLADAQAAGVHKGKQRAVNRAFNGVQDALHLLVRTDTGEADLSGLADLFFVKRAHSRPRTCS